MSSQPQKSSGTIRPQKVMMDNKTGTIDNYYFHYADFLARLATTFHDIKDFHRGQTHLYEDAGIKASKEANYTEEAEELLQKATSNLSKQINHLDDLKTKMKETLHKVNAKKLAQLKVKESDRLGFFFETFFTVFYRETEEPFKWAEFKKEVILKDHMEEFQSRLIHADFSALTDHDITLFIRIKEDPWIQDFIVKKKEGENLVELVNYIEFLEEAARTETEIKQMQKEIFRIKKEMPIKVENAKIQKMHAEILKENVKYLKEVNETFMKGVQTFQSEVKMALEVVKKDGLHRPHAK